MQKCNTNCTREDSEIKIEKHFLRTSALSDTFHNTLLAKIWQRNFCVIVGSKVVVLFNIICQQLLFYVQWKISCCKLFWHKLSQHLQITKLKIDSNPFAKGFRDSSRLTDLERYAPHLIFCFPYICEMLALRGALREPFGARKKCMNLLYNFLSPIP